MTLRIKHKDASFGTRIYLIKCPVCGEDLDGVHYKSEHFLDDHKPEDFGLTPLGERPVAADGGET